MLYNKRGHRFLAAALAGAAALGCAVPVRAADSGVTPTYDEAYYATLDYYGNLTEGSVVKSYIMNGATSLTDYGTYDSLTNLTDGTAPARIANQTTFTFDSADAPTHFYFQGETAEPFERLPWTLSLHYKLNGVATRAEALAGQKGVVEIDIDVFPNPKADDYTKYNYTLEAMALFNQDDILSLEAPGAQVQLIGNLRAVLFLALPGEERHFEIRVGAEDFSFGGMTFLMVPATLGQLEQVAELAKRKDDLEDNYEKLSGSLDALLDSLDQVGTDLIAAAGGLDALNGARGTVSAGKGNVYDKADVLRADLDVINEALNPVTGDLENASAALTEMKEVLETANTDLLALKTDLKQLETVIGEMRDDVRDVMDTQNQMDDIRRDIRNLKKAFETVSKMQATTIDYVDYGTNGDGTANDASAALAENLDNVVTMHDTFAAIASGGLTDDSFAAAMLAKKGLDADAITATMTAYKTAAAAGTVPEALAAVDHLYKLHAGILADTVDFEDFVAALLIAQGAAAADAAEQAAAAAELWAVYSDNPGTVGTVIDESAAIGNAVNASVRKINTGLGSAVSALRQTAVPAAQLCEDLDELMKDLDALYDVLYDANRLGDVGVAVSAKAQAILDDVDAIYNVADDYEPKAQDALETVTGLIAATSDTLTHTGEFADALEDLMKRSGQQLDAATARSLSTLAASLRSVAASLDTTGDIRDAKDTVRGLIEDTWDEHTGDIDNLLLMDAGAEPVSLTDPRNGAPTSVQVMIRTQEIRAEDGETATTLAVRTTETTTFWQRVGAMFRDIWMTLTGWLRF